jgi:acyl carrier protein
LPLSACAPGIDESPEAGGLRRNSVSSSGETGMREGSEQTAEEIELAGLIVTTLNLEVQAQDIRPLDPLYGEGLGLDSIDVLEIALAISKAYGVQIRADDANNIQILSSLRSLNEYIQQNRAR